MGILLAGKREDRRFDGVNSYLGEETPDTSGIHEDIYLNVGSKLLYGIEKGPKMGSKRRGPGADVWLPQQARTPFQTAAER